MKTPALAALLAWVALPCPAQIRIVLAHDDTVLRDSCDLSIPPDIVLQDANSNGVVQIGADDITVRFLPGTALRGADPSVPGDALRGIGIRIDGHRGVRILGARIHGFFNGLIATRADGLVIEGGDFSGNYRQRLLSTAQAENGADWLYPHHNDERKWRDEYGGALCIEDSTNVVIRGVRVRHGQNGILLDHVDDSRVYDNDCSFLSGWGLALWRSSRNTISRNALDFCVRGHVEGVYNRGQDSAGILCFEQCSGNLFAENSVTHGGDGFFGFAGREALGEIWMDAERERLRRETGLRDVEDRIRIPPEVARDYSARGCNSNVLYANDFSYAPAHGIEMTFSEGNVFAGNRLVENAICGLWGGYSSDSRILGNQFEANGGMAYGLERGGINMEHASDNLIAGNAFLNNKCAIHLWWDNDADLLKAPGVAGNDRGASGNVITGNTFAINPQHPFGNLRPDEKLIVLQLRDEGTNHLRANRYFSNTVTLTASNAVEFAVTPGRMPGTQGTALTWNLPSPDIPGTNRPVGARPHLRGRDKIVLDEWGPWDHESPFVRPSSSQRGERVYEVWGVTTKPILETREGDIQSDVKPLEGKPDAWRVALKGPPGVMTYRVHLSAPDFAHDVAGTLISARWDCVFFPWSTTVDPREKLDAWRELAGKPEAIHTMADALDFAYGWGGPRDLHAALGDALRDKGPAADHFGMIARARLALPRGEWRFNTLSDDGVRVTVNGRAVIENWGWHGPTPDQGTWSQPTGGEVEILVEHFEIDGYAVLTFDIEPVR